MSAGNRELVERYLHCYTDKNINVMVELFAEDAVFESVSNTTGVIRTVGKEELCRLAGMSVEFDSFPMV